MLFETIIYEVKHEIGYITINRQKALNALNRQAGRTVKGIGDG